MALEGVSSHSSSPFIQGRFAPIQHNMSWLESVHRADAKIPWVQTAQKIAKKLFLPLLLIAIFEGLVKNGAYLIANIAILAANRVYLLFHPNTSVNPAKENPLKPASHPSTVPEKTAEKIDAVSKSASPLNTSPKKQSPSESSSVKAASPLKKQKKTKGALKIKVPPRKEIAPPPPSPISSSGSSSEEEDRFTMDKKHFAKEAASPRSPSSPFAGLSSLYEVDESGLSPKKSLSSATTEPISPPPGVSTLSSNHDDFSGPMRRTSSPISSNGDLFSPESYSPPIASPMSITSTPLTPHDSRPSTTASPVLKENGASSSNLELNGAQPVTRSLSAPAKTEGNS